MSYDRAAPSPGFVKRLISLLFFLASAVILFLVATVPLPQEGQFVFFGFVFVLALLLRNISGRMVTLALIWLSVMVSSRYIYWRITGSTSFDFSLDMVFGLGLLSAEIYTFITLLLGYFQTAWPLKREPVALPDDEESWPTVDVYIPTYNESLKVVKPTIIGAMNLDWPKEKLNVYVLDDGRREEFREFAQKVGAQYIVRPNNEHAKAGNINHALTKTKGALVAIFDCDHVPVRSFLKTTVGWFLKDKKLAVVQTPHHFYSPDPFERNLGIFRKVPNEGQLFYGLIQDGNDLWDASFFCGSCAVLKRSALEEIGGIALGSVTEDAFTALKLHRHGYRSAYINRIQAAGLATESLAVHVGQRVRWARGMAQILRRDCPLWGRGLNWRQRLCYTNAMLHFFYGVPRLVFLTSPLAFLFFEAHIIQSSALMLAAYVLPFLIVANIVNSRLQGNFRHSFWAEVYETAVSWYSIVPTWLAIINPKYGRFNVTAKGGLVEDPYFDMKIALPYLILLLLNIAGLIIGVVRFFWWNAYESETVIVNLLWVVYNLIILGAVVAVAKERIQKRHFERIPKESPVTMRAPDGQGVACRTLDLSEGGGAFELSRECHLENGAWVRLAFSGAGGEAMLPARVVSAQNGKVRVAFERLTFEQERALTQLLYSGGETWSRWGDVYERDRPLRSLAEVVSHGLRLLFKLVSPFHVARGARLALGVQARGLAVAMFIGFMVLMVALFAYAPRAAASVISSTTASDTFYLKEMGAKEAVRVEAFQGRRDFKFSIRLDELVTAAEVTVAYSHSSELPKKDVRLEVLVNDETVRSIPLTRATASGGEANIKINPFLLSDYNTLSFAVSVDGETCETLDSAAPWVMISPRSVLKLTESRLHLPNDLAKLPLPFFDPRDQRRLNVPFAFGGAPDARMLEAAAAVSGWLGAQAAYRGAAFPAHLNSLPPGNSIVFAAADNKPLWLEWPAINGPALMLKSHPADPASKILLVLGRTPGEVKLAAHALVAGESEFAGDFALIEHASLAPKRRPYDAPNWLSSEHPVAVNGLDEMNFRVPPDLFTWQSRGIPMEFTYHFAPHEGKVPDRLNVSLNGTYSQAIPLRAHVTDPVANGVFPGSAQPLEPRVRFFLPVEQLSFYNQLKFYTDDHLPEDKDEKPGCGDNRIAMVTSGDFFGGSGYTLDFSKFHHHTTLPDLVKFANYGYPFTRYADLSETAVVLPSPAGKESITAFLTLMGAMGGASGAPVTGVSVTTPAEVNLYDNRDLIVLGGWHEQPLLEQWRGNLPLELDIPQSALKRNGGFQEFVGKTLGTGVWYDRHAAHDFLSAGLDRDASAIMAFESPLRKGRSAVVFTSLGSAGFVEAVTALTDPEKVSRIRDDTVIFSNTEISSFMLGETYFVGRLPWVTKAYWYLSGRPYLLFALALTGIFLLAFQSYLSLRRRAQARLAMANT